MCKGGRAWERGKQGSLPQNLYTLIARSRVEKGGAKGDFESTVQTAYNFTAPHPPHPPHPLSNARRPFTLAGAPTQRPLNPELHQIILKFVHSLLSKRLHSKNFNITLFFSYSVST